MRRPWPMSGRKEGLQVQVRDDGVVQALNTHQAGAVDELVLGEQIIPNLSVAVDCAPTYASSSESGPQFVFGKGTCVAGVCHTIDGDVVAAQDPEARGILEDKLEAVLLPISRVGRELNSSLDV